MSLQGQGTKAYRDYMDKVMKQEPPKVEPSNKEEEGRSSSTTIVVSRGTALAFVVGMLPLITLVGQSCL